MRKPSREVVLALSIGLLIGVGAGWWSFPRFMHRHGTPQERYQHILKRFDSDLALNRDQHSRVEAILQTERAKIEELHSDIEPRFQKIHKVTVDEIRRLLSADQQKNLDALEAQFEARRKDRPGPWGPPR